MNKRVFGLELSTTMNLPHQAKVLQSRKIKEEEIHKKEKKEKKLKKLQKERDIILKKVKGVKKSVRLSKNKKEEKVFQNEIDSLNLKFKNILIKIKSVRLSLSKPTRLSFFEPEFSSNGITAPSIRRRRGSSSSSSFDFN